MKLTFALLSLLLLTFQTTSCTQRRDENPEGSLNGDRSAVESRDSSHISFATFDAARDIITNSGQRLSVKPRLSGAPLIYSSYPEYIKTPGRIFTHKFENALRFRFFAYNVNMLSAPHYMGFAIKNNGTESADLYVSRRGYKVGSDSDPAMAGREAQDMWYRNAASADYYVASIPAGGVWYSTAPGGDHAGDFPTAKVSNNRGLLQSMYDMAVVGKSKKAVPFEVTSFVSTTQKPALDSLPAATGDAGANVFCPSSVLNFDVAVDFGKLSGASRYFDVFHADEHEKICQMQAGIDGAYGNYGIDYVINYKFANSGSDVIHVAAIAPVGSGAQYYSGIVRHHSGTKVGKSSVLQVNFNQKKVDRGRELAILKGDGSLSVETQLTGGNYAPVRIYTWTAKD